MSGPSVRVRPPASVTTAPGDPARAPRSWRVALGASYAVLGAFVGVVLLTTLAAVGVWLLLREVGPDSREAAAEVQRFYDASVPGAVDVEGCEFVPLDSESDLYSCTVTAKCTRRVVFAVPRAASPSASDAPPAPRSARALRLACNPRPRAR